MPTLFKISTKNNNLMKANCAKQVTLKILHILNIHYSENYLKFYSSHYAN